MFHGYLNIRNKLNNFFKKIELGYGDRGSPPKIGGGDVLVFQMEILEIKGDKKPAMTCTVDDKGDAVEGTCNAKEQGYITKIKSWESSKISKEITRLQGMIGDKMKPDLLAWVERRIHILKQLDPKSGKEEEL